MRRLLLIFVAGLWLAACGGDDPPRFAEVAPDAAQEALITAEDMPPGWRQGSGGTLDRADLTEPCDVLTPEGAFPEAAATASSASFTTVDQRSVQSFSAVYEAEGEAATAISDLQGRVERCRDDFVAEIRRLAEEEIKATGLDLGPFADIDVSIERVPLESTGDQALVYQIKVKVSIFGTERQFNADITLIRRDQVIGVLVYSAYAPAQTAEERAFLGLVLEGLEAAAGKLS